MKIRRALVTGGAGFIGSHLTEALVSEGIEATVLDNLSTGHLSNLTSIKDRITFCEGDIQDRNITEQAAKDKDAIFHLAAQVSVPQSVKAPIESAMINDIGTLSVFEAARKNHVPRIVFSSSCAVYGDDPKLPKEESMWPKPLSPYAIQKLVGEYYAKLYNGLHHIDAVCLRYFNVFGPRQDPSSPYSGVISLFLTRSVAKQRPVIYGDGQQYRDFVYVEDVVKANMLAANVDNARGNVINIGTGLFVRINELWQKICMLSGWHKKPQYESARSGDIIASVASIDQARSFLGFEPEFSFEKGLELTYEWYRKNQNNDELSSIPQNH